MALSKELREAYELAARPFIEAPGPTPPDKLQLKSWRYVIEVNSACNLRCIFCAAGNRAGYQHTPGIMDMRLYRDILDKAKSETPSGGVVCCYANSEPLLHPRIDEVVAHARMRGFRLELSTNLNLAKNLEAALSQRPDLFTVSVSGFTQETYARHHRGGNIEVVKENLKVLADLHNSKYPDVHVGVSYHMYKDNLHEVEPMQKLTEQLGLQFLLSWARVIVLEPTVQALRQIEKERTGEVSPYVIRPDGMDLNKILPPPDPEFIKNLDLLQFPPQKAAQLYARFPVAPVCLIGDVFTYIRHDGRVMLCPWVDDMRFCLGNYLEMSQEQLSAARRGQPFCRECLRYRLNLYFHIVDCTQWQTF